MPFFRPCKLQLQESAKRKGHFALYNGLVLGHTKYKGVQRIFCNPFPAKPFYGSHRLDFVMIRPPGIDHGAFVVSPSTVWYARVLLLFSSSATTDTESKSFVNDALRMRPCVDVGNIRRS
jgi:hypothetical protein